MSAIAARRLIGASGLAISLLLTACSGTGGSVATVNGTAISRDEYMKRLEGSSGAKTILAQMIQATLVDQYATEHKITVADSEVDDKLNELKARYSDDQFNKMLDSQNMTLNDAKKLIRQQLELTKSVEKDIKISDADIKDYFAKNKEQFNTPEQVHARHILVPTEADAQKVEAELKGGANFADVAKKYSKDPASAAKGGDLGFFGHGQMVKSFDDAAFSQAINAVGPPVKSQFGYHIVQVLERKPAVVATLDNSRDKIKKQLMQQMTGQRVGDFMQKLQANAKIDFADPKMKGMLTPAGGPG